MLLLVPHGICDVEWFVSSSVLQPARGGHPQDPPWRPPGSFHTFDQTSAAGPGESCLLCRGPPALACARGVCCWWRAVLPAASGAPGPPRPRLLGGGHGPTLNPSQSRCIFNHCQANPCTSLASPLLHQPLSSCSTGEATAGSWWGQWTCPRPSDTDPDKTKNSL